MTYYVLGKMSDGRLIITTTPNPDEMSEVQFADPEGKMLPMDGFISPFTAAHLLKWMSDDVDLYDRPLAELT